MKDTVHSGKSTMTVRREPRKPKIARCSICTRSIWLNATYLMEPAGAPEPRRSWVLCQECHASLLIEMRRSPVRSPLRLRIAMGLVAAERSPKAYGPPSSFITDHAWIMVIGWGFAIAMVLHLLLVVMLAFAR